MGKFFSYLLTLIVATLSFVMTSCSDENDIFEDTYYISGDIKIPLNAIRDKAVVFFYPENEEAIREELSKHNLTLSDVCNYLERNKDLHRYYTEEGKNFYRNLMRGTISGDYNKYKSALKFTVGWSPSYRHNGKVSMPNISFIALSKDGVDYQKVVRLAEKYKLIFTATESFLAIYPPHPSEFACTNKSKANAVEMARIFYKTGLFYWVEPVFIEE